MTSVAFRELSGNARLRRHCDNPLGVSRQKRIAGVSTAVGVLLAVVAVGFVVRALVSDWDEVRENLSDASSGWIVLSVALAAFGMTAIAVPWRRALEILGGHLGWRQALARYYVGELGKYIPGGVWPVVGRGELAARAGVPRLAAYGSVALSLASLYLAAMFLVLLAVPLTVARDGDLAGLWVLLLLPVGVLGLHHKVLERARGIGEKVLHRSIDVPIPRWTESLSLLALYVPAWLGISTATWAVARGLGVDAAYLDVAPAVVLSWIVGFVVVPVPGGVGIREAVFVAASGLDPGIGAAVSVVARVVFVGVDSLGALAASAWLARQRAGTNGSGASATASGVEPLPKS